MEEAARTRESGESLPLQVEALPEGHQFQVPKDKINSQADLQLFLQSKTAKNFIAFLETLNNAVANHKNSDVCPASDIIQRSVEALDTMDRWLDQFPPIQQPMRYGNKAFRDYFDFVVENSPTLMAQVLGDSFQGAVVELVPYWINCIGNRVRIDYGTGHETCFVAWMWCLVLMGAVPSSDYQALVTKVFCRYLNLVRKIQRLYYLEPAGSHGVWSLDDYQFLPFYWGSSQLRDHPDIKPGSILDQRILQEHSEEYLYLSSIAFIHKMKTGPFFEHSPILHDASQAPSWIKVNAGMFRMYKAEVLGKFPIMQHFLFGSLISFP